MSVTLAGVPCVTEDWLALSEHKGAGGGGVGSRIVSAPVPDALIASDRAKTGFSYILNDQGSAAWHSPSGTP